MTGASSRAKGAQFERKVAAELEAHLGWKFRRDLDQYRARDRGDGAGSGDVSPGMVGAGAESGARSRSAPRRCVVLRQAPNSRDAAPNRHL